MSTVTPQPTAVSAISPTDRLLEPFEAADWPRFLDRLDLPRARNYVILGYLPPRVPFDLRGPERARASLARLAADPLSLALSPAPIGHLVVGWQCGDRQGITSHTGDLENRSFAMLTQGWGLAAMLSTFEDGGLVTEAGFPRDQDRAFLSGDGVVLAAEVSDGDCARLRTRVAGFAGSPNAVRYGLLLDPGRGEGAGCLSFGAYLAEGAGLLGLSRDAYRRRVAVPHDFVGLLPEPRGVDAYRPSGLNGSVPARTVPATRVLSEAWRGPVADFVDIPDGEVVMAAMVAPRAGLSTGADWRFERTLPESDALVARASDAARQWAAGYPGRRIADPGGVSALVLER